MQNKFFKNTPSKKFLDIAVKMKSWSPVVKDGWIIKFSLYKSDNVLVNIISQHTGQFIARYFTNEDDACLFITYIMNLNSEEIYEL
jgi:hypothetical protein